MAGSYLKNVMMYQKQYSCEQNVVSKAHICRKRRARSIYVRARSSALDLQHK